jgi:predicted amidohydrolase YtcJ
MLQQTVDILCVEELNLPDLILNNANLYTQNIDKPHASAVAVRDGRILALGRDEEIQLLSSPHTEQIDLKGCLVLPGLVDAHIHVYEWALLLRGLALENASSLGDVQNQVQKATRQTEPGEWIFGQGWNQDRWSNPELPNCIDLDAVSPNNPVILWRTDLHLAWVNSMALQAAGITSQTPDPEMGIIDKDPSGEPNGILRELAINLVRQVLPPITEHQIDEAMCGAMAKLHQLGITGIHDFRIMGGDNGANALRAWQRLRAARRLNLRAWVLIPGEFIDQAIRLGLQTGFGDQFLRIGPAKFFSDGATGPRTAWMLESFEDGGRGMPLTPMDELAQGIAKADRAGIATAVHAIGDRAVRELLDVYAEVLNTQGDKSARRVPHRMEHVQHSHPEDLQRLGPLGLVASVQPLHITDDMLMVEKACGPRASWAYAYRDLLNAGTVLALGSDCPVASPNPFWGIHAAVTRQRRDGTPAGGWYPSQRLSVAEAVWGYTMGPALASGLEDVSGSITPGKLADLVVLDRDIFKINPSEIADTRVIMTVVDGQIVYQI